MFQIGILLLVVFGIVMVPVAAEDTPVVPPGFGPSYLSDTIPDRMLPGYSYPVFITFRNSGLFTWRNEIRRFGLLYEGDMKGVVALPSFVEIPDGMNISPGRDAVFGLTLLPVGLPGTYELPFSVAVRSAVGDQKITETHIHKVTIVPTDGISSPTTGSVLIESQFPDLTVYVDATDQGRTPAILPDLKPGKYQVLVRNNTFERIYPVEVEPGVMTCIYIKNENIPPWIEKRRVGPISDGTLIGYIEANIPLICIILGIIGVCVGAIIHGLRKRRRDEADLEEKESSDSKTPEDELNEKIEEEKKLLDKIHEHPPVLEAASPVSYSGSGSTGQAPKPNPNVWAGSNKISPLYLNEMAKKSAEEGKEGLAGTQPPPDLSLRLETLETKPGSATARIGISNRSPFPVTVEEQDISAGGFGVLPVQLKEPVDDSPDVTLSLRIFAEGYEFFKSFSIPYNRGVALLARGVIGKAYEFFRALLDRYPEQTDALYEQAGILLGWGLEDEAAAVLEEVLRLDPANEDAREALEKIRRTRRDREEKRKIPAKPEVPGYPDELTDRYTPIKVLGEDPFATIILVRKNDTGDLRALKIPHVTETVASTLFTEISLLYQLRHPYVLRMFRAEFQPRVFLELEYVSGGWYEGRQRMTLADLPVPLPE
ncbi:MAG: PEGA domain-containing protein, partial [Methanospirillum sp.]|nr:PEGA domain-containing protein [Methanospirillum sp.]